MSGRRGGAAVTVKLPALLQLEIVRYGLISVVAFALDVALLALLANGLGIHYLVSASGSFIAGGVVAYVLSVRYVFRFHRVPTRSVEATVFVALGTVGLAVNVAIMALAVGRAGTSLLVGKGAAACGTFGVNYLLRKFVLFWRPPATGNPADARR